MGIIWELARSETKSSQIANLLVEFDKVLGLDLENSEKYIENQKK